MAFFPDYDSIFDAEGKVEDRFLARLLNLPDFKFAPDDDEPGVAVVEFIIVDDGGNMTSLLDIATTPAMFLHGVVVSWEQEGADAADTGRVIGNVGPILDW